mmetsp:Transcript_28396/g.62180  ORF Transcript_28396/g.62180 Transcript_28396/m.62180 type:complete len:255 (-) Transcript_28396:1139-1903(-)
MDAERVLARKCNHLCEGDELVDAGRDGVEHVCKVGEVEASAARAAHHAAQQRPELIERLVNLDLDGVEGCAGHALDAHRLAAAQLDVKRVAERVRRVSRHDERVEALLGERDSERRGGCGLADAALAAEQHEALALVVKQVAPPLGIVAAVGHRTQVPERVYTSHLHVVKGDARERKRRERRAAAVERLHRPLLLLVHAVHVALLRSRRQQLVHHHVADGDVLLDERRKEPRAFSDGQPRGDADDDELGDVLVR